jgi:hypothetical protein
MSAEHIPRAIVEPTKDTRPIGVYLEYASCNGCEMMIAGLG